MINNYPVCPMHIQQTKHKIQKILKSLRCQFTIRSYGLELHFILNFNLASQNFCLWYCTIREFESNDPSEMICIQILYYKCRTWTPSACHVYWPCDPLDHFPAKGLCRTLGMSAETDRYECSGNEASGCSAYSAFSHNLCIGNLFQPHGALSRCDRRYLLADVSKSPKEKCILWCETPQWLIMASKATLKLLSAKSHNSRNTGAKLM